MLSIVQECSGQRRKVENGRAPGFFSGSRVLDAGNFKGAAEVENLRKHSRTEVGRFVSYISRRGFHAEAHYALGTNIVKEAATITPSLNCTAGPTSMAARC
jgi:hypothetical protein